MTTLDTFLAANTTLIVTGLVVLVLVIYVIQRRRQTEQARRARTTDLLAVGLLVAYAVLLVALGVRHEGLTDYSVEWDFPGHALRAQSVTSALEVNPRTPFGYPLSLWLVTRVTGDVFVSGKIITGLSALSVLGLVYLFGRRLFDAEVALFSMLVLLTTSLFAEHTIMVGTDLLALACLLASICLLIVSTGQTWAKAAAAGVLGGLSYLVRPSGIVLLPASLLWLWGLRWVRPGTQWDGHRLRTAMTYGLAFGLVILPQLILSTIHTGNPFYNNRAMDIWLDMYGNWDWARVPEIADITLVEVIRTNVGGFFVHWADNVLETLQHSPLDWPLALFAIPGVLALPWRLRRPELGLVYWFGTGYLVLVSVGWTTLSQSRVFMPLLPFLVLIATWLFCYLNPSDVRAVSLRLPWRELLLAAGLLAMVWNRPYYARFLEPGLERSHSFARPPVPNQLSANLDNKAHLVGYAVDPASLRPGETVHLVLYWQAGFVGAMDYTVFTHVIDRDGTIWAGHDSWPQEGEFPTSLWLAGEFIADAHEITLPTDIRAGEYQIEVGMYLLETMERLDILAEDGQPQGNSIMFPGFRVQAP